jgi:hypothetical protein
MDDYLDLLETLRWGANLDLTPLNHKTKSLRTHRNSHAR